MSEDEIDVDAAIEVGAKVIEMADRVRAAAQFAPGATAKWKFELDGRKYAVAVQVVE